MYAQTSLILAAMVVVFAITTYFRLTLTFRFIIASLVGTLVGGWGVPLRHFVEGSFGYFYIILILCAAMIMIRLMESSGALAVIGHVLLRRFHRRPVALLMVVMILLMVPGALTGIGGVAVLSTGIIAVPVLLRMGVPKVEAAAIVAMGAIYGMIAPPVNILAMLVADGINMPYIGFTWILLVLSLPPAIFSTLYLGLKHLRPLPVEEIIGEERNSLRAFSPLIVVIVMMIAVRAFPQALPDPSTPFILMVGAIVAIYSGNKVNVLEASRESLKGDALLLMGVLTGVGILVQIMTLTGVRGLLVIASLSLPKVLVYIAIAISIPLLGGVLTSFGAASVLAVTFDFYFVAKDLIVTTAALALICGLAELTPPTAISGILSAKIAGVERYTDVWKRCRVPALVTAGYALLVIILDKYFSIFT